MCRYLSCWLRLSIRNYTHINHKQTKKRVKLMSWLYIYKPISSMLGVPQGQFHIGFNKSWPMSIWQIAMSPPCPPNKLLTTTCWTRHHLIVVSNMMATRTWGALFHLHWCQRGLSTWDSMRLNQCKNDTWSELRGEYLIFCQNREHL